MNPCHSSHNDPGCGSVHQSRIQPLSLLLEPMQPDFYRQRNIEPRVRVPERAPISLTYLEIVVVCTMYLIPQEVAQQIAEITQVVLDQSPMRGASIRNVFKTCSIPLRRAEMRPTSGGRGKVDKIPRSETFRIS